MHIVSLYNHFVGSAHAGLSILKNYTEEHIKNTREFFLQI